MDISFNKRDDAVMIQKKIGGVIDIDDNVVIKPGMTIIPKSTEILVQNRGTFCNVWIKDMTPMNKIIDQLQDYIDNYRKNVYIYLLDNIIYYNTSYIRRIYNFCVHTE